MLSQGLRSIGPAGPAPETAMPLPARSGAIEGLSSHSFIDARSALIAKLQESEANTQRSVDKANILQAKLDAMEVETKRIEDETKRIEDETKRIEDEAKRIEDEVKAIVRQLCNEIFGVDREDIDDVRTGKLEPWNLILLSPVLGPRPHDGVFTVTIDASGKLFIKKKVYTAADYTDDPMIFFEAFKNYMRIYARFFNEQHPDVVVAQTRFADFIKEKAKYHRWSACLDYAMSRLAVIKTWKWHEAEDWLSHPTNWITTYFNHTTLKPTPSAKKRKRANSTGTSTAGAPNNKTVVRDADRPVFHLSLMPPTQVSTISRQKQGSDTAKHAVDRQTGLSSRRWLAAPLVTSRYTAAGSPHPTMYSLMHFHVLTGRPLLSCAPIGAPIGGLFNGHSFWRIYRKGVSSASEHTLHGGPLKLLAVPSAGTQLLLDKSVLDNSASRTSESRPPRSGTPHVRL
ncbi:hypothetical protein E4U60_006427 [Claviceps pazoutovae]|uniref:Uncharacterized protein n=1 Tax=Claviceps pazoutovae TaxID=1649127 RepID=A0A9P7SJM0_9HYPO|nr:hypothetical protein E4U60_006427 [Claviceps pazoutovae]